MFKQWAWTCVQLARCLSRQDKHQDEQVLASCGKSGSPRATQLPTKLMEPHTAIAMPPNFCREPASYWSMTASIAVKTGMVGCMQVATTTPDRSMPTMKNSWFRNRQNPRAPTCMRSARFGRVPACKTSCTQNSIQLQPDGPRVLVARTVNATFQNHAVCHLKQPSSFDIKRMLHGGLAVGSSPLHMKRINMIVVSASLSSL